MGFIALKNLLLALGLTIALVPVNSFAGKLDDFESSATKKKHEKRDSRGHPPSREHRNDDHRHHSDGGCHGFFSCLFEIFIHVDVSSPPTGPYDEADHPENLPHESGRPDKASGSSIMTVDFAYQNLESGIFGLDTNFQLRLKRVNIESRFTRYIETSPYDTLDVFQLKVVYPIRLGRSLTIGGALGIYQLAGNGTNTGGSFGFPISYKAPGSKWEFGMTPSWTNINGNTITDIDYRVSYRNRKTNFFAGHRAINTGSQLLSGPYIGLGLNF